MRTNPNGTLITIEQVENQFFASTATYEESPLPLCERWDIVCGVLPWAAKKRIFDDFTTELQEAYETGNDVVTFAAGEFCMIRWRFFLTLNLNDIGMRHVNDYELLVSTSWHKRLSDRYDQITPWTCSSKTYTPPVLPEKVTHSWLN